MLEKTNKMNELYQSLANVYHEIYQILFDYDEEFAFYDKHLKQNNIQSILEIGCGTGNLAKRLVEAKYAYLGIDLFQEMLDIATENAPNAKFMQADVQKFSTAKQFDCALITGRTISYLIDNQGLINALGAINKALKPNGLLMFDAIDAANLFLNIDEEKTDELFVVFGNNHYKRLSKSKRNLSTGWTWNWASEYYKKDVNGEYHKIGQDFSTLRAFIQAEVALFLKLSGFELVQVLPKKSYAWEDNFFIAKKYEL